MDDMSWTTSTVLLLSVALLGVTIAHAVHPRRGTAFTSGELAFATLGLGIAATALNLVHAFAAVAEIAPERKASLLAAGISQAMFAMAIAMAAVLLWTAPFLVGEFRRHRRDAPPNRTRQQR